MASSIWSMRSISTVTPTVWPTAARTALTASRTDPAAAMVVLDHDGVVEAEAVVVAAAAADRVLLEGAQAGRGLARVDDPGRHLADSVDDRPGRRGYATQVTEEVEADPLGRKDGPGRPGDGGQRRSRPNPSPVVDVPVGDDGGIEESEAAQGRSESGDRARSAGDDARRRSVIPGEYRIGGDVTGIAEVLGEGSAQDLVDDVHGSFDHGAVPVTAVTAGARVVLEAGGASWREWRANRAAAG